MTSSTIHPATVTPTDPDACREQIGRLGQRIAAYVDFMRDGSNLAAASREVQDKALFRFCEKLADAERQLARVYEALRLV